MTGLLVRFGDSRERTPSSKKKQRTSLSPERTTALEGATTADAMEFWGSLPAVVSKHYRVHSSWSQDTPIDSARPAFGPAQAREWEQEAATLVIPDQELASVDRGDVVQVLESPAGWWPMLNYVRGNRLIVRQCYSAMFSRMMERFQEMEAEGRSAVTCIIAGTPGIGKSVFLLYVVYQLHLLHYPASSSSSQPPASPCHIIVHFQKHLIVFRKDKTVAVGPSEHFAHELRDPRSYYLFDAGQDAVPVRYHGEIGCRTIIAASPSKESYKEYVEQSFRLFMPLWTYPELEAFRVLCPPHVSPTELNSRVAMWGGSCRWAAVVAYETSVREWKEAVDSVDVHKVQLLVGGASTAGKDVSVSHRVLHLLPTANYSDTILQFATPAVSNAIFAKLLKVDRQKMVSFILAHSHDKALAKVVGGFFEEYCHRAFPLHPGKKYDCRLLTPSLPAGITPASISRVSPYLTAGSAGYKFTMPRLAVEEFDDITAMKGKPADVYAIPASRTFPAIDSFLTPGRDWFQMTVSDDHGCHAYHMDDHLKQLDRAGINNLFFVVPRNVYANFPHQKFTTEEGKAWKAEIPKLLKAEVFLQWALCVPVNADDVEEKL